MKIKKEGRVVHSLSEKRKVQPKCLQGEWVEEGVTHEKQQPPDATRTQELDVSDTTEMGCKGNESSASPSPHPFSM